MHDIWNPWHGCTKVSEGCRNCYMFHLDRIHQRDGAMISRSAANFRYPLKKNRQGDWVVKSGETLRVCMTSDFFLAEADPWREEAWNIMRQRPDVVFFLLTKRIDRVRDCLPADWGMGWAHVMLNVSCEDQSQADARIPALLEIPARHKGLMCAPLIGPVNLDPYLQTGQIEQVICGGENYGGSRPCDYQWIKDLRASCEAQGLRFCFIETGSRFIKEGREFRLKSKRLQSRMAWKSGMSFFGRPLEFQLAMPGGLGIKAENLHVPQFKSACDECGSRMICNGCSECGKCSS